MADITTQIHSGDRIEVVSSTAGEPASMELGKLDEFSERLHVYVNGKQIELPKCASVNGQRENEFYMIKDGDDIRINNFYTVQEISEFLDMPLGGQITVNDTPAKADTRAYENFTISWDPEQPLTMESFGSTAYEEEEASEVGTVESTEVENVGNVASVEEPAEVTNVVDSVAQSSVVADVNVMTQSNSVVDNSAIQSTVTVTANATETISAAEAEVKEEEAPKVPVDLMVIVNKLPVTLRGKSEYVFVDIFDFINFDLKASAGRSIVTVLNGRTPSYMEPLKDGDVIEVYWK